MPLFTYFTRSNSKKVIQKKIRPIWFIISFPNPNVCLPGKPYEISNLRYGICEIWIWKNEKNTKIHRYMSVMDSHVFLTQNLEENCRKGNEPWRLDMRAV